MTEQELKHRIRNAIIFLSEKGTFKVGDLNFSTQNKNEFSVIGWTIKTNLKNITKETALTELNETKELFKKMISKSPELASFINNKQIEYILSYDDYGKVGIEICSEINGKIKWKTD